MASDLLECAMEVVTPKRLSRVLEAEAVGHCPTALQGIRHSAEEKDALVNKVIELRAFQPKPTVREIADLLRVSKSTIGNIVSTYGL